MSTSLYFFITFFLTDLHFWLTSGYWGKIFILYYQHVHGFLSISIVNSILTKNVSLQNKSKTELRDIFLLACEFFAGYNYFPSCSPYYVDLFTTEVHEYNEYKLLLKLIFLAVVLQTSLCKLLHDWTICSFTRYASKVAHSFALPCWPLTPLKCLIHSSFASMCN